MNRKRILWFFVFLAGFAILFQLGSMIPLDQQMANLIIEEISAQVIDIDATGIFVHNLAIATVMFIPGVGMIFGLFAGLQTGMVVSAVNIINPEIMQGIPAIVILFLTPFGLMEIVAYSLGMSRSLIIIQNIKSKTLRQMIKPSIIEYGIVVGLLLVGGFVEFWMIQQFDGSIFMEDLI